MALQIQLRRGTTTNHSSFIGAMGEVTVDTSKNTLVVHDGVSSGGHPVTFDTVTQAEAEEGTSGTRRTWTAQRVRQAATAMFNDAMASRESLGVGQTWQDMTTSRDFFTTYTNSSGNPIMVVVTANGSNISMRVIVDGVDISRGNGIFPDNNHYFSETFLVPNGMTYYVAATSMGLEKWMELR